MIPETREGNKSQGHPDSLPRATLQIHSRGNDVVWTLGGPEAHVSKAWSQGAMGGDWTSRRWGLEGGLYVTRVCSRRGVGLAPLPLLLPGQGEHFAMHILPTPCHPTPLAEV